MFKLLLLFVALAAATPTKIPFELQSSALGNEGKANIFLSLESTAGILSAAKSLSFPSRASRKIYVAQSLKSHAEISQNSIQKFLAEEGVTFTSFWITNQIYIRGANAALIQKLAAREDVLEINKELTGKQIVEPINVQPSTDALLQEIAPDCANCEWGLQKIDVEPVWNQGFNGTGVRVGVMDSGVRLTHVALHPNYVGEYGWFAPIGKTPSPVDTNGHGTHCTGTIVGLGGIGVAPGAKWMACSNIPGDQAEDLACGQFFLCPTLPDGSSEDCSKAADLVSNSWGYGGSSNFFDAMFDAWVAAGIVPLFAAGNEGPGCSTLRSPGNSISAGLITVGSTDINDNLSGFSSFGPSPRNQIVKPDIAGPGSNVRSSYITNDNSYTTMSGTSMATPHVAGVAALLLSADPTATVAEIGRAIYMGAAHTVPSTGRNCGGIQESTYPNNHVGYGRLSASGALNALRQIKQNA